MTRDEILTIAQATINGPRRESFGSVQESFERIAQGWGVVFGVPVTATQVAMAMTWLKVVRELNSHQDDNLVDICGYAALAAELQ